MKTSEENFYRQYTAHKRDYARSLRRTPTETEKRLWTWLRNRRLCGYKFHREVAMGPYIVDFRCRERRLIVEIDGEIHETRKEYDAERDLYFRDRAYRVLHVSRLDVEQKFSGVIAKIRHALQK